MILFWVFILVGIAFLVHWLKNSTKGEGRQSAPQPESPLEILKRRYASGEITKEQYESMKRDIQ